MRAGGQDRMADMLSGVDLVPGQGIDFDAVGRVLLLVLAIYVVASVLMWASSADAAGVVQRTMYRLREDVEAKLGRLPLAYFDGQPARRAAQPGDQRHRQRRHVVAADHVPAAVTRC
jgi:ATP-binding cassette subfamily B multidrug efflux pump